MGGSSGSSRTTSTTEPPAFIQPFLQYGAGQARGLYETGGPQQFPGSTVVPFSQPTEEALALTRERALNGSQVGNAAQGYVTNTLNSAPSSSFGNASNPFASAPGSATGPREFAGATNPYLDATFNRAADQVQNRLQSSFASAGRNTGAARAPAALELNDLANQVYGGAYESDRNRSLQELGQLRQIGSTEQQQRVGIGAQGFENAQNRSLDDIQQQRQLQFGAAGLAPQLANQDYADLAALEGVGGRIEDLQGQYLDDEIARFDFQQNSPQINLDRYLQRITGTFPGQVTTQNTPTNRNRGAGALGGAATGASLGASFGPYGALLGGLGGGLLGAFG